MHLLDLLYLLILDNAEIFIASVGASAEQRRPTYCRPDLNGSAPSVGHTAVVALQFISKTSLHTDLLMYFRYIMPKQFPINVSVSVCLFLCFSGLLFVFW